MSTYEVSLFGDYAEVAQELRSGSFDTERVIRVSGTSPDPFLAEELEIASVLGETIARAGKKIMPTIEAVFDRAFSVDRMVDAIKEVNPGMSDLFVGTTQLKVLQSLQRAVKDGARLSGNAAILDEVPSKAQVLDGMLRAAKYTTNNYFNQQVVPKLFDQIQGIISSEHAVTDTSFYAVKEAMEARLKSVPYWRTVANGAASRAYHYGVMKAGQMTGRRAYMFRAILDTRTTKVCRNMNGKEFWIADGLAQAERIAAAEPEELRTVSPWLRTDDVVGKDANALKDMNAVLPPLHANCRSTVQYL